MRAKILLVVAAAFIISLAVCIPARKTPDVKKKKAERYSSGLIFPHKSHAAGGECIVCHKGAAKETYAGYPGIEDCYECHDEADHNRKKDETCNLCHQLPVREKIERPKPTLFALTGFKHADHAESDKDCAQCHGKVGETAKTKEINLPGRSCCRKCHEE
jgi:hypothetical protein